MSDKYQEVRSIPLGSVLAQMGFTVFKKAAGKTGTLREMPVPSTQEKQDVFLVHRRKIQLLLLRRKRLRSN